MRGVCFQDLVFLEVDFHGELRLRYPWHACWKFLFSTGESLGLFALGKNITENLCCESQRSRVGSCILKHRSFEDQDYFIFTNGKVVSRRFVLDFWVLHEHVNLAPKVFLVEEGQGRGLEIESWEETDEVLSGEELAFGLAWEVAVWITIELVYSPLLMDLVGFEFCEGKGVLEFVKVGCDHTGVEVINRKYIENY